MEITNVKVIKREKGRCKGIAEVVIEDCFVIHNIRIIEGEYGLFIAFPSIKSATKGFLDACHPIKQETREKFTKIILEEYERTLHGETAE